MSTPETKNVLLISYLFPPIGGSGSLRPLKMAKYLPQCNWVPVILTVRNPDWYYAHDPELLEQLPKDLVVMRTRMIRAAWLYRSLNPFRIKSLDGWIRKYLMHPDEQIGWLPFAYWRAIRHMKEKQIHAIYSTSGPLTCHLIALLLKNHFRIPWIAEFRDEWFEAPNLPLPTNLHKRMHYLLEQRIVNAADRVVTLAPGFTTFLLKHGVTSDKFTTIPAGYDPDDLKIPPSKSKALAKHFTVVFAGLIYETFPPDGFLASVNSLIKEGKIPPEDLRIRFVGANTIDNALDPFGIVECTGFLPRSEAIESLLEADMLLLLLSRERGKAVIPSKVFEYMASGKPIFALVPPDGAAAEIIERTKTGFVVDYDDHEGIKRTFLSRYRLWKTASITETPDRKEISQFDQRVLFQKIAAMLNELTKRNGDA